MKKKTKGIVLIIVMLLLLVFAALALQTFEISRLGHKISQNQLLQFKVHAAAEAGLHQAEQALIARQPPPCIIDQKPAEHFVYRFDHFIKESDAWWQSHQSCQASHPQSHVRFVIEKLARPSTHDHLYRITVRAQWEDSYPVFLQTVYLAQANDSLKRLSWQVHVDVR